MSVSTSDRAVLVMRRVLVSATDSQSPLVLVTAMVVAVVPEQLR